MTIDTIVAIATPPGRGGVGIIRLSGVHALAIAKALTGKKKLNPREAHFCLFRDHLQELLDQGLVLYFPAPNSFTGEDVVEFQVHGAPIVLDRLLAEACHLGARLARPGEFSERAFLNDKIDLAQAEAIADLIHASSEMAARMAIRSLQGEFSKAIHALNENIIHLRLYVEAAIDFPEEEIDFLADGKIEAMLQDIMTELERIRNLASQGAMLREGLSIVIAGRPNAGKSTLMNTLSGREVAIVTDVAGTTRDVMREHILLDEIPVHLIDTAGLHESSDPIEQEGIKRAWLEVKRADCVLLMIDARAPELEVNQLDTDIRDALPTGVPIIRVYNKIDSLDLTPSTEAQAVYISAKSGAGLPLLIAKIKEVVGYHPSEGQFLARRRHLKALEDAHAFLVSGREQLTIHRAGELLADDLRQAHQALCEITGEFTADDLLGKIFSSFCIGK
ncbi:tRNA uridine-5-carboxymethylaminomethyl(34) synthesis GTPase MnmE [Legionella yabuuchiae]|uniref:tRNA uridine-5-carboxymethylaminomethyl(34) synthesis GTPase MnmE n=1 Tax=Legionella yabuuchiae TaxID=376727 RepID=UPI0010562338|nr:tRNA uridine-5-carboxymethylaminomethyl(34) synthesis GTPase MnmE [Legionella yabuuchiae]